MENSKQAEIKPQDKIGEYVDRINKGETIESFGEIPESWKTMINDRMNSVPEQKSTDTAEMKESKREPSNIEANKKLRGWGASYELARIAKEEGVDLSTMSREKYAEYAIKNYLAIDDDQLRVNPLQRNCLSVEEALKVSKDERSKINEDTEKNFHSFSYEMMHLAEKEQKERFISPEVRILSGTKDSNSWLYFSINNGTNTNESDTFKSYFSLKDLNTLTPERFKKFLSYLQEKGYNGGVKIFQDLTEQGTRLNDQVVMHGYSEMDARVALRLAEEYFRGEILSKSFGKDEMVNGESKSYSQVLSEDIYNKINKK